ncbi:MAG: hypothetical protein AAB019_07760 [Planctomycetota bacterium]|mgnify:CR=1 FL=1
MKNLKTLGRSGFLVVKRFDFADSRFAWRNTPASVSLSDKEIMRKYKGFDGEPWPEAEGLEKLQINNGVVDMRQYDVIVSYYEKVSKKYPSDFLYLDFPEIPSKQKLLPSCFFFCGYDCGIYLSESNRFSVIYNAVIYGSYDEMRKYSKLLNEYLLLSSLEDVKRIHDTHTRLRIEGADLETEDEYDNVKEQFGSIAIYAFKSCI